MVVWLVFSLETLAVCTDCCIAAAKHAALHGGERRSPWVGSLKAEVPTVVDIDPQWSMRPSRGSINALESKRADESPCALNWSQSNI